MKEPGGREGKAQLKGGENEEQNENEEEEKRRSSCDGKERKIRDDV